MRVKTLRKTNLVPSRYIKREKVSLPIDARGSKTPLLKLPNSKGGGGGGGGGEVWGFLGGVLLGFLGVAMPPGSSNPGL